MAFKLPSRVLETTISTGTGAMTLGGAIDDEHRAFADALSNSDTTFYFIEGGDDFEIGYGTYSGGVLTRTTVIKSSNSNNAVDWPSGKKLIGIAPLGPSDLDATNLGRLQEALGIIAATTSAKGLVELATTAETLTGTDTARAVTPAGIAGSKSLAASGYYKLPGGLIVQWGTAVGGAEYTSVTFPVAFPTACRAITASVIANSSTTALHCASLDNVSTTGFRLRPRFSLSPSSWGVATESSYWTAVGY
jgi:hypothetical protein